MINDHFGHGHHMHLALSVAGLRKDIARAQGFNAKLAVLITGWVSTMWCAYIFALISFLSLPAILTQAFHLHVFPDWIISASLIALVAWVSSYFLQLVLLSVVSVQSAVEGVKAAVGQKHVSDQVDIAVDRLDTDTKGGLQSVMDRIDRLESSVTVTVKLDPQQLYDAIQKAALTYQARNSGVTVQDILDAKKKSPPGSNKNSELHCNRSVTYYLEMYASSWQTWPDTA